MPQYPKIEALFIKHSSNIPLLAQSCADTLPQLFPNPDKIHIRISLNKFEYASAGFSKSAVTISRKIRVQRKCRGKLEIHIADHPEKSRPEDITENARSIAQFTANRLEKAILALPTSHLTLDSEKRYQLLAKNSIDVIWIMDPLLNFTYVSPSIQQLTGYTVDEWVGTNLAEHATRKEFLKMAGQAIRAMREYRNFNYAIFTANMLHKDGSTIPVEIIGKLLLNKKGFPIGVQGSTRDISERIRAEKQIKTSEQKYLHFTEKLYQSGIRLGQTLDLQAITITLYDIIKETMPCDRLVISSFNTTRNTLVCEAMIQKGQHVDISNFPSIPLKPKGEGAQSQVIHTGNSLYLPDYRASQKDPTAFYIANEEGIVPEKDIPADQDMARSAILAPLEREGKAIGVVQVISDHLDAFTTENLHFLEAFTPQVSAAISNAALYEETQQAQTNLLITLQGTVEMLARVVEKRDPYTAGHQQRVADLAVAIAEKIELDQEQVEAIHMASIVHDIGKINVPAEILSKPGKLSQLEFELIKAHPQIAADLLRGITFPWPIAEIILQHHEKLDGSGYPHSLTGDQIAIEARILIVADIVEAMSSHRPYREALGVDSALAQIQREKGNKLDPQVVDACQALFDRGYHLPPTAMN